MECRPLHAPRFSYVPERQDLAAYVSRRVTVGQDRQNDRRLRSPVRPAGLAGEMGGARSLDSTTTRASHRRPSDECPARIHNPPVESRSFASRADLIAGARPLRRAGTMTRATYRPPRPKTLGPVSRLH